MILRGGITLSSPTSLWPIFGTIICIRGDWTVRDVGVINFGRNENAFGIQLNTFDSFGNICQNVIWFDGKGEIGLDDGKTTKCIHFACVVSPKNELLWRSALGIIPFDVLRNISSKIELSFAEFDSNLNQTGGQCNIYQDSIKPAVFSNAFLFPKEWQPVYHGVGFGLAGFGNGSEAIFSAADFHLWLGEEGYRTPFVLGGVSSAESSNLICSNAELSDWMANGAKVAGNFTA